MIDQEEAQILKERLSKLRDQINQRVDSAEERINNYGFGIRCFINLDDKHYSFGYSKEKGKWGLYLMYRETKDSEYQIWHLSAAPSAFRIECLEQIDRLEEHLLKAAAAHAKKLEDFLMGKTKTHHDDSESLTV